MTLAKRWTELSGVKKSDVEKVCAPHNRELVRVKDKLGKACRIWPVLNIVCAYGIQVTEQSSALRRCPVLRLTLPY